MTLFQDLLVAIGKFLPLEPITSEKQLESYLLEFLEKSYGFKIERQVSKKDDRYDLICKDNKETICIELKINTDQGDIEQFDRYLKKFRDGFIIVSWQVSASMREIFENVQEQSPIPIQLIELSRKYF